MLTLHKIVKYIWFMSKAVSSCQGNWYTDLVWSGILGQLSTSYVVFFSSWSDNFSLFEHCFKVILWSAVFSVGQSSAGALSNWKY